jgi:hypothetical protein
MMTLAALIWLLHAIIPHSHQLSNQGIDSVSSLENHWTKGLFSFDLGEHHLEEAVSSSTIGVAYLSEALQVSPPLLTALEKRLFLFRQESINLAVSQGIENRGPPSA